ncbi:MAG: transcriptional regulator, partial [Lachnospiraceae bacterium]|nr:transcriptional regulator [Lachnospiraceae bacterium]
LAFGLTFFVCAAAIIIQLIIMETLPFVIGETITLLAGGIAYIGMMVHSGVWEAGTRFKSTPLRDILISAACSWVFTAALILCYIRLGATAAQTVRIAILFFAGTAILGFAVLRLLTFCNQKRRENMK